MAEEEASNTKVPDDASLREQHGQLLEVYRTHFELFVKAFVLYLATVSVISGFILEKELEIVTEVVLGLLITIGSAVTICACLVCRGWTLKTRETMNEIADNLGWKPFSFSGATGMIWVVISVGGIFYYVGIGLVILRTAP